MHEMVYAVRDEMQDAYPELKDSAERVAKVVLAEEQQFARVLGDLELVKLGCARVSTQELWQCAMATSRECTSHG